MHTIRIKTGKEKQLLRHHPWVFSGAILAKKNLEHNPIVRVETAAGAFIAWGWYDAKSHIPLRLLSWQEHDCIDEQWWIKTIEQAVERRAGLLNTETTACRLIHGEADFLSGVVADQYGPYISVVMSSRMAWTLKPLIVQTLETLLHPDFITVSTDAAFCSIEQLPQETEWYVKSKKVPPISDTHVQIVESGLFYTIVAGSGQKSGFYCDQRENRLRIAPYVKGRTVLDACSYTGAFSLHALRAGAHSVEALDASKPALEMLRSQVQLNEKAKTIPSDSHSRITTTAANVFEKMRTIEAGHYDFIILDPPKLAQTKAQAEGALRAYKDLNRLAMLNIAPDGIIATFSCSGAVSREQFRMMLAWAAKDANREIQILETLGQPADHPIRLSFPESEYLKGFIVRVI